MEPLARVRRQWREMARSLRLVKAQPQEAHSVTYVVSRTRFIQPGTAYVIAALVDPELAEDDRYTETEVYTPGEMRRKDDLPDALRRWENGDHDLFRRDREAHDRIEAAYRATVIRSAQRHPSMLSRA
jgi:hypothetical protein